MPHALRSGEDSVRLVARAQEDSQRRRPFTKVSGEVRAELGSAQYLDRAASACDRKWSDSPCVQLIAKSSSSSFVARGRFRDQLNAPIIIPDGSRRSPTRRPGNWLTGRV